MLSISNTILHHSLSPLYSLRTPHCALRCSQKANVVLPIDTQVKRKISSTVEENLHFSLLFYTCTLWNPKSMMSTTGIVVKTGGIPSVMTWFCISNSSCRAMNSKMLWLSHCTVVIVETCCCTEVAKGREGKARNLSVIIQITDWILQEQGNAPFRRVTVTNASQFVVRRYRSPTLFTERL